ncbi:MAG TPA: hypothetical protein VMZ71_09005 [Gemmataceae bacterium]|nr:hypothetical protein [Gemmataceae bacterium]
MQMVIQILLVCGALDMAVGGALLGLVWLQYRRQRESAERLGLPVPRPATGQFVFLGAVVGLGFVTMCAALVLFIRG